MDALAALAGYDDEEPAAPVAAAPRKVVPQVALPLVQAAPAVETHDLTKPTWKNHKLVVTNPKVDEMYRPMEGPLHPAQKEGLSKGHNNHRLGNTEDLFLGHHTFDSQYNTFNQASLKLDVKGQLIEPPQPKKRKLTGTFAGFESNTVVNEEANEAVAARKAEILAGQEEAQEVQEVETERVTSTFHGGREHDYQGRAWCEAPQRRVEEKELEDKKCFCPKQWIHTFTGHTMGVNGIRLFPSSNHLLLSCSMDSTVKIWEVHNQRRCMRTYTGHSQAVRDVQFTVDGKHFYSAGFDNNLCQWDTETGQIISTFSNKKTPYCIAINPDPAKQYDIITGHSNKKAVQWDVREAKIVQEYDEHLGAVNTITICDDGKKIVTSSDDKKIYVWEYGIPVVVKHIAEVTMHSVPAITVHPSTNYFAGQSMDNKIIVYEARGKFKFQGRKQYKGHLCAGYAIKPGFSACGRYIMSGDCDGKLWFWDWKTNKNIRTIKCHDGVLVDALWHNTMPSRVFTAGWDGMIKLWD